MDAPAQTSRWERSTTARFVRWLLTWRIIRRLLLVLGWVATIVALLYGEEHWRGRHAWEEYRRELEARGEQLDYRAFIPKPVPDEQNFAATPFVKSWFRREANFDSIWGTNFGAAERRVSDAKLQGHRGDRHFRDLAALKNAFAAVRAGKLTPRTFESDQLDLESRAKAAPAILEELKVNEPAFAELRAASQRPYFRYPLVYDWDDPWGILLPHLANIKHGTLVLNVKARAELAAGQSEGALEDIKLMLFLADSLKDEPFLVCYLVRVACVQIAASAVWEGLAEHAWSEGQLRELQMRFQQFDFLADTKRTLSAERAEAILTVDLLLKRKYRFGELFRDDMPAPPELVENLGVVLGIGKERPIEVIARIVPRGWYYQEKLNYCRVFHTRLESKLDPVNRRVEPVRLDSGTDDLQGVLFAGQSGGKNFGRVFGDIIHHRFAAQMLLPGLGNAPYRAAAVQITSDQAALACALERYRLANQQFPDNLQTLVPRFISSLPHDVLTGEPYKYRRTNDGQFVLYSVGWNGKDDGGVPGKTLFDETKGDWVWRYPPN